MMSVKTIVLVLYLLCFALNGMELSQINALMRTKDYARVVKVLEEEEAKGNPSFEVMLYLGNAYFLVGQNKKAFNAYKKAMEIKPGAKEAAVNMASVLSASGEHEKAIELYKDMIETWGEVADVVYNTSVAYRFLGKLDEAEKFSRRAYQLQPDEPQYINGLGEVLNLKGQKEAAVDLYKEALRAKPNSLVARLNLARSFIANNDLVRAESEAKVAVQTEPASAEAHEVLGDVFKAKGDIESALYEYRNSLSRNPRRSSANASAAAIYESMGQFEDAKYFYYNAVEYEQGSMELVLRLGNLLFKTRDFFAARDALNQASVRIRRSPQLLDLLGQTYTELRNFEKAEIILKEALEKDSTFTKAKISLGTLYFEQGRFSDALGLLEDAYKNGYETYELNFFLGRIYLRKNREQDAIKLFSKLLTMDPRRFDGYLWLGKAYENVKDFKKAELTYFKAIEFLPKNPEVYLEIAEFIYRQRLTEMWHICKSYYDKTLELDPKHPKREHILETLKKVSSSVERVKKAGDVNQ